MKSVLWIPCYNEGTQKVSYSSSCEGRVKNVERHTSYETLRILLPSISQGLFHRVIVTDDGSTDDTEEGIQRFRRENNLPSSFQLISGANNVGKMHRFFEAFEQSSDNSDMFVMTDADMVACGTPTFSRLAGHESSFLVGDRSMLVSMQGEYVDSAEQYDISGVRTTGTRSLIIPHVRERFRQLGLHASNFPGKGYGLEPFLNHFFGQDGSFSYINKASDIDQIPLFLRAFRKGRDHQLQDVRDMREFLGLN